MSHESAMITLSNQESLKARAQLFELLKTYPGTDEETERSLGLFLRASLLSRLFGVREIYEQIVSLPGIVLDIGTWRGQTAVLCENLRAIFEPLNFNRRIVCFDTFEGYRGFSDKDSPTEHHGEGTYNVGKEYADYLEHLLTIHEKNNAMGHNHGKHKVVAGDVRKTLPAFFVENPYEVVALAFLDLNAYQPTEEAFAHVFKRLVPGGIIAFWQLTRGAAVGAEGSFYSEQILNNCPHTLHRSRYYPGLCYLRRSSSTFVDKAPHG